MPSLSLRGPLIVLSALLCWPLAAADVEPETDVDLKLTSGRPTVSNSIGMKLVLIPKGRFTMGALEKELIGYQDEKPQHAVEITKDFHLGATEVTQKQWQDVMGSNPSCFNRNGREKDRVKDVADRDFDHFPVEYVNWDDTQTFFEKLNARPAEKKAGRTYRLPTEAEWEHACRAGARDPTKYSFGNEITHRQANFRRAPYRPCKVASYPPNTWGIYDVHGNVWEWCEDRYHWDYYKVSPKKDPQGPEKGMGRVGRGGGWNDDDGALRSSKRRFWWQDGRNYDVGFRVVMVASQ